MAEEFLNINPPDGFPDKPDLPDDEPPPGRRPGASGLKNIFVFLVLALIVVASFFVSFQLGSRILSPVKVAIPETPASIKTLQKLQAIMSQEAGKVKAKVRAVVAKRQPSLVGRPKTVRRARTVEPRRLTGKHYYKVQVGLFEAKAEADQLGAKVQAKGFDLYVKKVADGWRVQAGAYRTKDIAEELRGQLTAQGFNSQIIYE
jgi:cell division protein FtsN